MAKLRVTIIDEVRSRRLKVDLPDDAAMEKLLPALAKKLGLPPAAYRLTHEATGRALGGDQTLASFGVGEGDALRLAAAKKRLPAWAWVGIVVVALLAVAALGFLVSQVVKPEPTPTVVARVTTPAATSTAVPRPTATPIAPTFTPLPPTDTLVPTSTPRPTATPVPPTDTPVPTSTPSPAPTPTAEKILFKDDFEDGKPDGWTVIEGKWEIIQDETGNHVYSGTGSFWGFAVAGSNRWKNYALEVKAKGINAPPPSGYMAASVRVDWVVTGCQRYVAHLFLHGSNWVHAGKYGANCSEDWEGKSYRIQVGEWYLLRFEVVGDFLKFYVNNKLLLENKDSELKQGYIGLSVGENVTAYFDDVRVIELGE